MDKRGLFDFSLLSVKALSSSRQIISRPWPGDESSTQSTSTPQFSKSRDKILFHSVPISAHRCVRCRLPDAADFYMARRKDTRNPGQTVWMTWQCRNEREGVYRRACSYFSIWSIAATDHPRWSWTMPLPLETELKHLRLSGKHIHLFNAASDISYNKHKRRIASENSRFLLQVTKSNNIH